MSFECLRLMGTFIKLSCLNVYVYFFISMSLYILVLYIFENMWKNIYNICNKGNQQ